MKVNDYKIWVHGIEGSQYFQGAGLSGTEWRDCATGTGSSRHDAVDSAIDCLAQSDWEFEREIDKRLSADIDQFLKSWRQDLQELREAMDCRCEGDGCAQCEGSELHWFVTVYVK